MAGGSRAQSPPPAHRSASGRPGASPPGCSGCKPPGKTRREPGSGRRCSCLWGESSVSAAARLPPGLGAGGSIAARGSGPEGKHGPKTPDFLPKGGSLPSLIRVMASSFLPPLFPLSSSSDPDPAGDKTPSAVAGTRMIPASPGRIQHQVRPLSPRCQQRRHSRPPDATGAPGTIKPAKIRPEGWIHPGIGVGPTVCHRL